MHKYKYKYKYTQLSDELLRQMGTVDYEAVMRDLTLLMTDSQVVNTVMMMPFYVS